MFPTRLQSLPWLNLGEESDEGSPHNYFRFTLPLFPCLPSIFHFLFIKTPIFSSNPSKNSNFFDGNLNQVKAYHFWTNLTSIKGEIGYYAIVKDMIYHPNFIG